MKGKISAAGVPWREGLGLVDSGPRRYEPESPELKARAGATCPLTTTESTQRPPKRRRELTSV